MLVCVPDHWHARMAIDAMKAGKAVYCEKPMIRDVEEGPAVIAAQKETKAVFQVGSQYASSIIYDKVKELIRTGRRRQSPRHRGAVQPQLRYRGLAILDPHRRVARRRSTGIVSWAMPPSGRSTRCGSSAGAITGIMARPSRAICSFTCLPASTMPPARSAQRGSPPWEASATGTMAAMSTTSSWACSIIPRPTPTAASPFRSCTDFEDGGGGATAFRFVGTEGVIDVSFRDLSVTRVGIEHATANQVLKGYNSVKTFSNAQQKAFADKFMAEHPGSSAETDVEVDREIRCAQGLR